MNRGFCHIALLCAFLISFHGCTKEDGAKEEKSGSIYGVITDFATGKPVQNANVQLRPGGGTTLTGYDGMYEFMDVPEGTYYITVSKAEYTDLVDEYPITVSNGKRMRRDAQIKKLPTSLRITDINGTDIKSLDFGSEISVTNKAFNIFNNGTVSIRCSIVYSCAWIISVSSIPDKITLGQTVPVSIVIDRTKLNAGDNTTNLYITSNNGSNVLTISAIGQASVPQVLTLPVTDQDGNASPWCDTFHAKVTNIGNPPYHARGFCFSSTNANPTINDNRIDVEGTGVGEYSYTEWKYFWDRPYKAKYYVRAWVMYGPDNKIEYGNVQSFVYNDV